MRTKYMSEWRHRLLLVTVLTPSVFSQPLVASNPTSSDPRNTSDSIYTTWLSFEGSVEQGIAARDRIGYSILNITAQPWSSGARRASELEYIEVEMLDPRRRKVAHERTFYGYRWHSFPEETYIPRSSYDHTWFWSQQPVTLKKAFAQLAKSGVQGPFKKMSMGLNAEDPSVSNVYRQICYEFYVDDPKDPERYYGVGASNGAVFEVRSGKPAKLLNNADLRTNLTVYKD